MDKYFRTSSEINVVNEIKVYWKKMNTERPTSNVEWEKIKKKKN